MESEDFKKLAQRIVSMECTLCLLAATFAETADEDQNEALDKIMSSFMENAATCGHDIESTLARMMNMGTPNDAS